MSKLQDVANKAKVSIATASLALNDSPLINYKTKEKIRRIAEELKYYPNIVAQRLARGKSYNLLLALNSKYFFSAPKIYYLQVIGGIIKEAENTEYTISFSFYGDECSKIGFYGKNLNVKNIDGMMIFDVIEESILEKIIEKIDVPIVLVDNHKLYPNYYSVDNDDYGGAYKATKYLIELGHTKIGYISIPEQHPLEKECWKGFKKALEEKGLKESIAYKKCEFGIRSGKEAISYIISKGIEIPTAFFCVSDYFAIGAIEELKSRKFKVPDDFSVIGMDDIGISSEIDPPLTTIKVNMEGLGQEAIKKLILVIENRYKGSKKTILDNELIERKSCRNISKF